MIKIWKVTNKETFDEFLSQIAIVTQITVLAKKQTSIWSEGGHQPFVEGTVEVATEIAVVYTEQP